MKFYLGIDIGTTHIKACIINEKGRTVSCEVRDHETVWTERYGAVYDPCLSWEVTMDCIKAAVLGLKQKEPDAVLTAAGITSMAEAGVPVDKDGMPLTPVIAWNQAVEASAEYPEELTGYPLYQRTGLICHPKYTINRLLWLRETDKDLFDRMDCWLSVADYILFCMTGEYRTDTSLAGRTLLFNINTGTWDPELTRFADMEGRLPEIMNGNSRPPVIPPHTAGKLGLPQGMRVVCAGHDHLCAALAEQKDNESMIFNSMGTSEVYTGFIPKPEMSENYFKHGIVQGRFDGRYFWMCNLPSSGASVEWLRTLLSVGDKMNYEQLMALQGSRPSDVFYLPFLNGAGTHRHKTDLKGTFFGFTTETKSEDMVQAVYDGIAMEGRYILERLDECGAFPNGPVTAAGGGIRNRGLMETKANAMNRGFRLSSLTEAAAAGAAIRAAGSTGTAVPRCGGGEYAAIEPDGALNLEYEKKYVQYKHLCRTLDWDETENGSMIQQNGGKNGSSS